MYNGKQLFVLLIIALICLITSFKAITLSTFLQNTPSFFEHKKFLEEERGKNWFVTRTCASKFIPIGLNSSIHRYPKAGSVFYGIVQHNPNGDYIKTIEKASRQIPKNITLNGTVWACLTPNFELDKESAGLHEEDIVLVNNIHEPTTNFSTSNDSSSVSYDLENISEDLPYGNSTLASPANGSTGIIYKNKCKREALGYFDESGTWINCPYFKWLNGKSACSYLKNSTFFFLGDSTMRRLYYTVTSILKGSVYASKPTIEFNALSEERLHQHLPDQAQKRFLGGPKPKWGYSTIACNGSMNITYKFMTHGSKIKHYIKNTLGPNITEPVEVVFTFGIYNLVKDTLLTKAKNSFHRLVKFLHTEGRKYGNLSYVWRTPPPVNPQHERFANITKPPNIQLEEFANWTLYEARQNNISIIDTFNPLVRVSHLSALPIIEWESGEEWSPPQHGGIHLLDAARKVVAQIVLNELKKIKAVELQGESSGFTKALQPSGHFLVTPS